MSTQVTKFDGTSEVYNEDKIRASASRVGVPASLQAEMLMSIRDRLFDGITTKEIFVMIKEFLRTSSVPHLAMKYNLKQALSELGPSGYPFEKYLSLILQHEGYQTQLNQTIAGSCVTHEIDILANKNNLTYFIEAKFHRNPSQRTDVRVALYIKARFDDLSAAWTKGASRAWIMTNTRFSTDAIKYSECQKIRLTSWDYPKDDGIASLIDSGGLWPITIIDALTPDDKMRLIAEGVVVCRQLLDPSNQRLLSQEFMQSVLPELTQLCQNQP